MDNKSRTTLQEIWDQYFYVHLEAWIDNRIGHAMFLGACLPELAQNLTSRGISVMVVEEDVAKLEAFHKQTKKLDMNKRLSFDTRPYKDIKFESSSYNLVVAWDGMPQGLDITALFKKLRRELKAGAYAYIRTPIRSKDPLGVASIISKTAKTPIGPKLEQLRESVESLFWPRDNPTIEDITEQGGKLLKLEEILFSGQVLPRIASLSPKLAQTQVLWTGLERILTGLDRKTVNPKMSPMALIKASRTLDLGHVFLTGSRFDPRFSSSIH
jgi:hypothetical protein